MSTPPLLRVVEREALVYARLWRGLAFSTFVQPALYLAAMGIGLGGMVSAHSGRVDGLAYLDFVAPGLLVASAMQLAASESMWPVLGGAKWMRQFHGVVATPIGPGELFGGFVLGVEAGTCTLACGFRRRDSVALLTLAVRSRQFMLEVKFLRFDF